MKITEKLVTKNIGYVRVKVEATGEEIVMPDIVTVADLDAFVVDNWGSGYEIIGSGKAMFHMPLIDFMRAAHMELDK